MGSPPQAELDALRQEIAHAEKACAWQPGHTMKHWMLFFVVLFLFRNINKTMNNDNN